MYSVDKRVIVEFEGGFQDGKRLDSASADPNEAEEAIGQYFMSSNGTVGKRFRTYSDAGRAEMVQNIETTPEGPRLKREPIFGMDHVYELVDRQEDDATITIRFQYRGGSILRSD